MKCEDCNHSDKMKYVGMKNDKITYCNCSESVFYQMTVDKNMSCAYYEPMNTTPFKEVFR